MIFVIDIEISSLWFPFIQPYYTTKVSVMMKKFLMFLRFLANIEFYPIDIDGVKYAVIHFSKK